MVDDVYARRDGVMTQAPFALKLSAKHADFVPLKNAKIPSGARRKFSLLLLFGR
jgi:hypothetical protein